MPLNAGNRCIGLHDSAACGHVPLACLLVTSVLPLREHTRDSRNGRSTPRHKRLSSCTPAQEHKCHVILGTSEDFMYYWLEQRKCLLGGACV